MYAAANPAVRTDRFCSFEVSGFCFTNDLFICKGTGGTGVDALAAKSTRRLKQVIVEE